MREEVYACVTLRANLAKHFSLDSNPLNLTLTGKTPRQPPPKRSILPALANFRFKGVTEYLEGSTPLASCLLLFISLENSPPLTFSPSLRLSYIVLCYV